MPKCLSSLRLDAVVFSFATREDLGLVPPVLFSTSETRARRIVSRDLLHGPAYMRRTHAHMHACAQLHGLCEHSGTLLYVNYGHKL